MYYIFQEDSQLPDYKNLFVAGKANSRFVQEEEGVFYSTRNYFDTGSNNTRRPSH